MALQLFDRVQVTATANTTVSFTLGSAVAGYQSFSVMTNGNTTYYGSSDGTNWEVGIGTYSTTGPTLTRTTILSSSNSGSAVTFTGTPTVWIDYPSSKSVYQNGPFTTTGAGFTLQDATDTTKQANFSLANLTTGTTYAYTLPAVSGAALATLGNISQTFAGAITLNGATTIVGLTETVTSSISATPVITPTTGTFLTWSYSSSATPTAGTWASGQGITLHISNPGANTITWTSMPVTWVGGVAPTISSTLTTIIELWKVGSTIYGAYVGTA